MPCTIAGTQCSQARHSTIVTQRAGYRVRGPTDRAPVVLAALPNRQLGEAPFLISARASSGLPVSFSTATFQVCQISGGKVTVMTAGICTIVAQQDGNAAFNPALVVRSFIVIDSFKQVQTITFDPLPNKTLSDQPFTVSANASSGLMVAFGSDTPNICVTNGNIVTLISVGTCIITASQAGDNVFNPAPLISRSFAITSSSILSHKMYLPLVQR